MAAFATGVLPNIYEFHLYTGNSAILSRTHKLDSLKRHPRVKPRPFTPNSSNRLRALYAQ